jgi:hypothetical protein
LLQDLNNQVVRVVEVLVEFWTCAGAGNTPPLSPSQGNPGGTGYLVHQIELVVVEVLLAGQVL